MIDNGAPLEQLKRFLNQLFQFDSQDLDFGVYKILHYKSKEIKGFIDDLLVKKVKEQLQTLSDAQAQELEEQQEALEKDDIIKGWLQAEGEEKKTLEKFGKDKIAAYQELKAKAAATKVSVETENQIYNHLTLFFSRYYDKGDFISKRRFGKNEKYVVPYNGEETHFHWANHDQYYIKSSETFQHYAFKVQTVSGNLTVNFKLHNAQLEQGNVKADAPNFFLLSEKRPEIKENATDELSFVLANKAPDIDEHEVTFYFEYRPLDDKEKAKVKKNTQDTLDELAYDFLKKQFHTNPLLANLWQPVRAEPDSKPLLLKKLRHYTRKNKYDFFIHKNLKGFLARELDYYIKSELISVDDLYVMDTDSHFDRLKHNLKTIKVFKTIADTIIDFISQIEDFQKKLWEKKKFVLSTEWVITIDRLVEYISEEAARPLLEEVIKNEQQVAEWKELFGKENVPKELSIDTLKADLHTWRKLPIDTKYFANGFKNKLLNSLSEKVNLEVKSDNLVINSDNFHGITLIENRFNQNIKCLYIDPPYNSSYSEIIYKNTFKHSSWISLIQNRIEQSLSLLREDAVHVVAIDENEQENLGILLKVYFGEHNNTCVTIVHNPSGQQSDNFSYSHEYAYFNYPRKRRIIGLENRIDNPDVRPLRDVSKGNHLRIDAANCFYPILTRDGEIVGFGDVCSDEFHPSGPNVLREDGILEIFPIDAQGEERKWVFARNTVETIKDQLTVEYNKQRKIYDVIRRKTKFNFKTVWTNKKYSANSYGAKILNNILGEQLFSFPKSIYTVKDCIGASTHMQKDALILDYFAGSGTTFHATQLLNREDKGSRKCILIEQGGYVYSVIIPRIKKIAYTFDWKDGRPKGGSMNGLGIFFKYQRLEQYEEALENIAFNASDDAVQMALEFDQYIPKYFLEFETKGSQTLVNTAAMQDPWNYQLKVWDGFTYDTRQAVDLVETFNYLIGLHMQKCLTQELNGKKYQFVIGHNNAGKQIAVVWRSVKDWTLEDYQADAIALQKALSQYTYDLLYINDQAHLEGYQPIEEVFKNKMLG